ncbi:MAG TPA: hypothetical protein PK264_08165, partial [Hyphomicrobiaceae bacterium]|nr:hypothetical protein [Hyphomicrobiaceae bacterium]
NGDFQINQRLFAGGALAAGAYGFDRWKGGASGASCSVSGMIVTLTSGSLTQVIEVAQRGHATLAAQTVTVSVDALSGGNLTVTLGSQTGTITAGSGRRSTTLTLEVGDTGNIALTLAPVSAAVTFSRVRAELGRHASAWLAPSRDIELSACQRYYWRVGGVAFNPIGIGRFASTTQGEVYLQLPTEMRTIPTVSTNGVANFSFNGVVLTGLTLHAGFNQRRDFVGLLSTVGSAAGTPGDMAVLVSQPAPAGIIEFSAEL